MKSKNSMDDKFISELVQSVRVTIPDAVEDSLNEMVARKDTKRSPLLKSPLLWYPISAAVATVLIVGMFIFSPLTSDLKESKPAISEIKTEFEIKDKNIKIIWIQRKDFKLN